MKKQNGKENKYLLDSSAFISLFEDEEGADIIQELLEKARNGDVVVFASFVSYTEIFYITFQEE